MFKKLFLVFITSLVIRFLFFPDNVYFAFDQARDSFFAQDILKGDLRIVGPPSAASGKLFAGPLSLYLYSLVYLIFGKSPEILSAFFRIYNSLGVFLVFFIASKLFGKKVGILSGLFYAVSYEQSQYSLFMSHQPLAVIPVLLFYLGLTLLIFKGKEKGLVLSLLGLGLAIQFHYVYLLLIPIFFLSLIVLGKNLPKFKVKTLFVAIGVFFLTIGSYLVSEIKFAQKSAETFASIGENTKLHFDTVIATLNRFFHDSFLANYQYIYIIWAIIFFVLTTYLLKKGYKNKFIFLFLWLIGGLIPYLVSGTVSYYYSAGATVSLLIVASFIISKTFKKFPLISVLLFAGILANNLFLIVSQNRQGPNKDMIIQPGMLIKDEKSALDYIYKEAKGKPFAVNALTIPLSINTTWSYLFEWYGSQKYGYLPIWSVKSTQGFLGNLQFETKRSELPKAQFVIIEPTVGIKQIDIDNFFNTENIFSKVVEEKSFGTIVVQKRLKF